MNNQTHILYKVYNIKFKDHVSGINGLQIFFWGKARNQKLKNDNMY